MGKHSAPSEPADARSRVVRDRRPGPKHSSTDSPRPAKPRAPRKVAASSPPTSAAPSSSPPAPKPTGRPSRGGGRTERAASAARDYADRAALKASLGGKPSVTGSTVSGAAGGAATGAALGSVVPGIGTAAGAVGGAVVGGTGGAISGSRKKKTYKQAMSGTARERRWIVTEFAVCAVIVALAPLTDKKRDDPPNAFIKRMSAVMLLFFVLGIVSSAGRGPAKVAAGFGGLVTLALAVSERNLFAKLADIFATSDEKAATGTGPTAEQAEAAGAAGADAVASIIADMGDY